ncbi:hypothetical protein Psta_3397 [Pirellula staleyi DSM 6068]|uniref:SHOCT domain-containing protein n=1 Tax=Pirellula staleyi (strain ATCC 27377 / DSM 6068 / ICPB 4128) TaxID=530564 RepID=D2QXY4_PIRSD|nr:SHOCT domain-containing protein [Pirellula staleyi]ADB18061.1 hypothetical protein Psta_3397 [Pirellula staleyi DSM 6068]
MNLVGELEKLSALHAAGALSAEEFAAAKQKLLASDTSGIHFISDDVGLLETLQERVEAIESRQATIQLDRCWDVESRRYQIVGKHGVRSVPTVIDSLILGIGVCGIGGLTMLSLWFLPPLRDPGGPLLFVFGLVTVAAGLGCSYYWYVTARNFKRAEKRYRDRRRELSNASAPEEWLAQQRIK